MSAEERLESPVYRRACCVHHMQHVVEIPIVRVGRITGNVHFGPADPEWDFSARDIQLANALDGVLAVTLATEVRLNDAGTTQPLGARPCFSIRHRTCSGSGEAAKAARSDGISAGQDGRKR